MKIDPLYCAQNKIFQMEEDQNVKNKTVKISRRYGRIFLDIKIGGFLNKIQNAEL